MKYRIAVLPAAFLLISILSCNQSARRDLEDAKSSLTDSGSRFSDTEILLPQSRFVRSASLKTKVRSVSEAMTEIENKTRALGGYVGFSHFVNHIQDSSVVSVSRDSLLQIMHYYTGGFLTLRVPDYLMDSLLANAGSLSACMLDREIRADDVGIRMLAGQLASQRAQSTHERLVTDIRQKGRKLPEIEQAEKTLEAKQQDADEGSISGMNLEYAVRYSTITMEIYQDPVILYKELAKERTITEYQSPFISQLGESLSYGWQMLKDFMIMLCRYWIFLLLAIIGYAVLIKPFQAGKKMKTI